MHFVKNDREEKRKFVLNVQTSSVFSTRRMSFTVYTCVQRFKNWMKLDKIHHDKPLFFSVTNRDVHLQDGLHPTNVWCLMWSFAKNLFLSKRKICLQWFFSHTNVYAGYDNWYQAILVLLIRLWLYFFPKKDLMKNAKKMKIHNLRGIACKVRGYQMDTKRIPKDESGQIISSCT